MKVSRREEIIVLSDVAMGESLMSQWIAPHPCPHGCPRLIPVGVKAKPKIYKICGRVGRNGRGIREHRRMMWPECITHTYEIFKEQINKRCFKLPTN